MSSELTKETKSNPMEEQIDQLVAQFKVDLLAQVRLLSPPTKTNVIGHNRSKGIEAKSGDVPTERDAAGNQIWKNAQGQIHRDRDKPAIIRHNGIQEWYQYDQLHRDDDKPAVFRDKGKLEFYYGGDGDDRCTTTVVYGLQKWYQHGQLHRSNDQPAIVKADGFKAWYQHGRCHRDGDQPARIEANGDQYWYHHNQLHRDGDQPALIEANGDQYWYHHNQLHRTDGKPAIIRANGEQEWWVDGKCVKKLLFKTG